MNRYFSTFFAISLVLIASAPISVSETSSDSWGIETVENGIHTAVPISMALDNSNNPHAVYCNPSNFDIKYVYYNGTEWNIEILHKGGLYPSLALDKEGNPHIAYEGTYTISYASSSDGKNWKIMDLDPTHNSNSMFLSIALDSSGNPHISYVLLNNSCPTPSIIQYATLKGGVWNIETIDKAGLAYSTSIALDSGNHPHIVYIASDYSTDYLKYAWFDGINWHKQIVDTESSPSLELDGMALDSKGYPHICYESREYNEDYTNITKADLEYAWFDGINWHKEKVTSGISASLALDSKCKPRMAYSEFDTGKLRYAWFDGERWQSEMIYDGPVGSVSMALDKNDIAHIFFIDSTSLKYAVEEGQPVSNGDLSGALQSSILSPSLIVVIIVAVIAIAVVWYFKKKGSKGKEIEPKEVKPKDENEQQK